MRRKGYSWINRSDEDIDCAGGSGVEEIVGDCDAALFLQSDLALAVGQHGWPSVFILL
jgi:hypothetical protein